MHFTCDDDERARLLLLMTDGPWAKKSSSEFTVRHISYSLWCMWVDFCKAVQYIGNSPVIAPRRRMNSNISHITTGIYKVDDTIRKCTGFRILIIIWGSTLGPIVFLRTDYLFKWTLLLSRVEWMIAVVVVLTEVFSCQGYTYCCRLEAILGG